MAIPPIDPLGPVNSGIQIYDRLSGRDKKELREAIGVLRRIADALEGLRDEARKRNRIERRKVRLWERFFGVRGPAQQHIVSSRSGAPSLLPDPPAADR